MRERRHAVLLSILAAVLALYAATARGSFNPTSLPASASCFYVLTGNASPSQNVALKLSGWTKIFDQAGGNFYNAGTSTSRFVFPVTGTYLVTASINWVNGTGAGTGPFATQLYKNNALYIESQASAFQSNADQSYVPITAIIPMTATDYIEVYSFNNAGASWSNQSSGATGAVNLVNFSATLLPGQ